MYDRLTDRARKVMQLANQEAVRFNHEYIGTEHILLGLIKEWTGVAGEVLKNLDIDLRTIRLDVEKLLQSGPDTVVTFGKFPTTPRAKKVIEYSMEEARNLNHDYVGTEHLLIGLVRESDGVAAQVLINLGLTEDRIRLAVTELLAAGTCKFEPRFRETASQRAKSGSTPLQCAIDRLQQQQKATIVASELEAAAILRDQLDQLRNSYTDRLRLVRQLATCAALRSNQLSVGTEHLLLGILEAEKGVAASILEALKVPLPRLRAEIESRLDRPASASRRQAVVDSAEMTQAIEYAHEEAQAARHNYVGTEHFLFGILRVEQSLGAQVLSGYGVTLDAARGKILNLLGQSLPRRSSIGMDDIE